ncbi:MAG: alpha/beta fold hydrolase [Acidobacteriota bacterium]|nr:alpha/beta fold hydrolase [Acidobacteriota bacterium]
MAIRSASVSKALRRGGCGAPAAIDSAFRVVYRSNSTGRRHLQILPGGRLAVEPHHSFEQVAACRVSVLRGGAGQPLLFLHGAGGAGRWLPFMDLLAEKFEVIVPEHPGFGLSDTPPWLDNIGDVAYFYLDFIEALKLKDVHLVGSSLGGWIASETAIRDQHPFRTLTLVAPAGIRVNGTPTADIFLWSREELARNLFHNGNLAEAMLNAPMSEEEQNIQLRNSITMAKLAWQPRMNNPDLKKWLHRIHLPTLIIWGDSDRLIPPSYGRAFQSLIPGSRLEVIPVCGHLPHMERTSEFVTAVASFIGAAR